MGIDWLRDLIIVIFGLVGTVVLIFLAVLAYLFYRRVSSILDSVKAILGTVQSILAYVGGRLVKPAIRLVSLIQGIRQGIKTINKLFRKRRRET